MFWSGSWFLLAHSSVVMSSLTESIWPLRSALQSTSPQDRPRYILRLQEYNSFSTDLFLMYLFRCTKLQRLRISPQQQSKDMLASVLYSMSKTHENINVQVGMWARNTVLYMHILCFLLYLYPWKWCTGMCVMMKCLSQRILLASWY